MARNLLKVPKMKDFAGWDPDFSFWRFARAREQKSCLSSATEEFKSMRQFSSEMAWRKHSGFGIYLLDITFIM